MIFLQNDSGHAATTLLKAYIYGTIKGIEIEFGGFEFCIIIATYKLNHDHRLRRLKTLNIIAKF